MKILLVGINAKYVHTNLALLYLKAALTIPVAVREFTINEEEKGILAAIVKEKADFIGFSCYIWNRDKMLRLAENIKKIQPKVEILFGGPEVSYEAELFLQEYAFIDFVIRGPGERALVQLLQANGDYQTVKGLTWRALDKIRNNPLAEDDWTTHPSPFLAGLEQDYRGKNIYYETSRGCPYRCTYCLSGNLQEKVRFLPLERVKAELQILSTSGAKQIKFVDRTFNCHKKRTLAIWRYILRLQKGTNYHFEVSADLLDEEMIALLAEAPKGLFNLEIGVQTVQEETLLRIDRKSNQQKTFAMIKKLLAETEVHVHLDLIIGLPEETYEKFAQSFETVLSLAPHKLQIGFLKLLRGSRIRAEADLYDYQYLSYAPYEVLCNRFISYEEISFLQSLEHVFDKYYNSGKFLYSLRYLKAKAYPQAFVFYEKLTVYWEKKGYFARAIGLTECYQILAQFVRINNSDLWAHFSEILRFDYLLQKNKGNLPDWCGKVYDKSDKENHRQLLGDETLLQRYAPQLLQLPWKDRLNLTHSDWFSLDVTADFQEKCCRVLFIYKEEPEFQVVSN